MADWSGSPSPFIPHQDTSYNASITEKILKREEERQLKLQKKKESGESQDVTVHQSTKSFLETFNSEMKSIEDLLAQSTTIDRNSLIGYFDDISLRLTKLQRYVSESTIFLPGFELKTSQNFIVSLQTKVQEKNDELLPKKKFAFKSNRKVNNKKAASINVSNEKEPIIKESKAEDDEIIELADCKFVGASNEKLQKNSEEITQKDVALASLSDCDVRLYGAPSAIHVNKLKNCKVLCGPVSGSIFIRECVNCTFVLACQQLRIHSTFKSSFYIHVTSKAIVEDCHDVQFASYNFQYSSLDEDYVASGLNKDRNNWDKVDDFNWLVANKQSPHWSILDLPQRITSWDE